MLLLTNMKKILCSIFIFVFSFTIFLKTDFLYAIEEQNASIVDCSGLTQEELLYGIYINHQLNNLYDQVSHEKLTRSSIKKAILSSKNGKISNLGSIEVELDLSHWPKVDASSFDHRSQMSAHPSKTLASIVARIRTHEIDVTRELSQGEIDQAIWKTYFSFNSFSGGLPESALLIGLDHFKEIGLDFFSKVAIDIGCGRGRDTKALINTGWKVYGIDFSEEALSLLRSEIKDTNKLHLVRANFEEMDLNGIQEKVYLINSSYTLPYAGEKLDYVWDKIVKKLEVDGLFTGQFFGKNEGFANVPGIITQSKEEVMHLLKDFEILSFKEREWDGKRVSGEIKHWHVFEVVAKKKRRNSP